MNKAVYIVLAASMASPASAGFFNSTNYATAGVTFSSYSAPVAVPEVCNVTNNVTTGIDMVYDSVDSAFSATNAIDLDFEMRINSSTTSDASMLLLPRASTFSLTPTSVTLYSASNDTDPMVDTGLKNVIPVFDVQTVTTSGNTIANADHAGNYVSVVGQADQHHASSFTGDFKIDLSSVTTANGDPIKFELVSNEIYSVNFVAGCVYN